MTKVLNVVLNGDVTPNNDKTNKTDKIVRLDIVDNDYDNPNERILDTYYLINPDAAKLNELKTMISTRFDSDWWDGTYDFIYQFICKYFKRLEIDIQELEY